MKCWETPHSSFKSTSKPIWHVKITERWNVVRLSYNAIGVGTNKDESTFPSLATSNNLQTNLRFRYKKLKTGVVQAQALFRGRRERKRYAARKAELKRRLEAERLAQQRAKERAARESQRAAARATAVHHLEIPAELAFIFSKLEGLLASTITRKVSRKPCFRLYSSSHRSQPSKSGWWNNGLSSTPQSSQRPASIRI